MNKGQVLITFDDCTSDQQEAAYAMTERGLTGTFGAVTDRIDTPGFITLVRLKELSDSHFICNHSRNHIWSGGGQEKEGLKEHGKDELTSDYHDGRECLNAWGMHGDYLMAPFGTANVLGEEHLAELIEEFKWIQLTFGAPLPEELELWTPTGGKRLYPHGYPGRVIGISAAADMRHPGDVKEKVENTVKLGCLCVLLYHRVGHVVGNAMNLTWERFIEDMDMISGYVTEGGLECVTPDMLIGE